MKYVLISFFLFVLLGCNESSTEKHIGHQIADANGLKNFEKIKSLEFTFNAQRDTAKPSSRHWQWFPKTNDVVFITDSATTKFKRHDTTTQELKKLNARFTNDEYWLLFPYHLSWDKGCELIDSNMQVAPISGKKMQKITARYNDTDGYTPGDAYDVYVDENKRVHEWVFFKGGDSASMYTSWENYKEFNGMQLAQEHKSKDGKFRIWLSDIKVTE